MSTISVTAASQKTLDRAAILLAGVNNGIQRAMRPAMERASTRLKKLALQKAKERYAVSSGSLRPATSPKITYSMGNGITASIVYGGQKIPLYKFDGSSPAGPTPMNGYVPALTSNGWRMVHPGSPAKGHVLKSTSPASFEHAFVATMGSGHTGIFERDGDSISEIMGVSVPQMVGSDEYKEQIATEAMDYFEERMNHEVMRLIGGA